MKKLLFANISLLFALTLVAASCSNDGNTPVITPPDPDNRITMAIAVPDFIEFDTENKFTVTIGKPVDYDLTIGVSSSDPSKVIVPDYVVLKANKTEVSGKITTVSNGKATISVFCADNGFNVVKPYDDTMIYIEQPAVDEDIIVIDLKEDYTYESGYTMPANPDNNYWICPIVIESSNSYGINNKPGRRVACLWYHNMSWEDSGVNNYGKATIDNFGCPVVGKIEHNIIYMTMLDKDVIIDNSLPWVENESRDPEKKGKDGAQGFQCSPHIYSYRYTENAGRSGYLVTRLAFMDDSKEIPFGFYRAWIEATINTDGSIVFGKVALCCNNRIFKTGQEKN